MHVKAAEVCVGSGLYKCQCHFKGEHNVSDNWEQLCLGVHLDGLNTGSIEKFSRGHKSKEWTK